MLSLSRSALVASYLKKCEKEKSEIIPAIIIKATWINLRNFAAESGEDAHAWLFKQVLWLSLNCILVCMILNVYKIMKKILTLMAAALLIGCSSDDNYDEPVQPVENTDGKTLVVYLHHSRGQWAG